MYGNRLKVREENQSCHVVEEGQAADRAAVRAEDAGGLGLDRAAVQGYQIPASVRLVGPKRPMNGVSPACR